MTTILLYLLLYNGPAGKVESKLAAQEQVQEFCEDASKRDVVALWGIEKTDGLVAGPALAVVYNMRCEREDTKQRVPAGKWRIVKA